MKRSTSKALALILNFALVGTSFADAALPGLAAPRGPDFLKTLTPPTALGYVTSSYQGKTEKPVVLIQDLHSNYGVQKKIFSLLKFLQPNVASGQSMVIGVEGAWGDINLDKIRSKPLAARQIAGDFLLKNAEITGMDHFAALSEAPVRMVGVDNPADYIVHRALFQKSLVERMTLAQKLDALRLAIARSKGDAPRSLRRLWKLEDQFRAGSLSLEQLSKELGVVLNSYGDAESALARQKNELAEKQKDSVRAYTLKNVIDADQGLDLLSRLLRYQLTLQEVQYVSGRIPQILATVQVLLPGENLQAWKEATRSAVDHYAMAILRDKPLSQHALSLAQTNPQVSVVVVTGGFHTAGIEDLLRSKSMSYVVIAPVVESHTAHDDRVYIKRMMGVHLTDRQITQWASTLRRVDAIPPTSAQTVHESPESTIPDARAAEVYDQAVQAATGKMGTAKGVPSSEQILDQTVDRVTEARPAETPGAIETLAQKGKDLVKGPEEIPLVPEATATEPSTEAANPDEKSTGEKPSSGIGGKVLSVMAITAVLGSKAFGQVSTSLPGKETFVNSVNANTSSDALTGAIATLAAVTGIAAWKYRKEIAEQARVARNKALTALQA